MWRRPHGGFWQLWLTWSNTTSARKTSWSAEAKQAFQSRSPYYPAIFEGIHSVLFRVLLICLSGSQNSIKTICFNHKQSKIAIYDKGSTTHTQAAHWKRKCISPQSGMIILTLIFILFRTSSSHRNYLMHVCRIDEAASFSFSQRVFRCISPRRRPYWSQVIPLLLSVFEDFRWNVYHPRFFFSQLAEWTRTLSKLLGIIFFVVSRRTLYTDSQSFCSSHHTTFHTVHSSTSVALVPVDSRHVLECFLTLCFPSPLDELFQSGQFFMSNSDSTSSCVTRSCSSSFKEIQTVWLSISMNCLKDVVIFLLVRSFVNSLKRLIIVLYSPGEGAFAVSILIASRSSNCPAQATHDQLHCLIFLNPCSSYTHRMKSFATGIGSRSDSVFETIFLRGKRIPFHITFSRHSTSLLEHILLRTTFGLPLAQWWSSCVVVSLLSSTVTSPSLLCCDRPPVSGNHFFFCSMLLVPLAFGKSPSDCCGRSINTHMIKIMIVNNQAGRSHDVVWVCYEQILRTPAVFQTFVSHVRHLLARWVTIVPRQLCVFSTVAPEIENESALTFSISRLSRQARSLTTRRPSTRKVQIDMSPYFWHGHHIR